jgi:hypothetical protein
LIESLVFVVVGSGVPAGDLRRRVVFGVELSSFAAAERAAGDFAVRIVLEAALLLAAGLLAAGLLAAGLAAAFFVAAGFAAAGFVAFAAGLAGALATAAFFAGAAAFVLLVELSALAASDRAAGDFAVRIVFAASVLVAGLAAAFVFAGALAVFGSAFAVTGAAFVALGAADFLAGALGAAFGAVLVAARTAIACARGVAIGSSLLIVPGSLGAVSSDARKRTAAYAASSSEQQVNAGDARGVRGRRLANTVSAVPRKQDDAVARPCHAVLRVGLASVQVPYSLPSCVAIDV